jgi:hypothetical protein
MTSQGTGGNRADTPDLSSANPGSTDVNDEREIEQQPLSSGLIGPRCHSSLAQDRVRPDGLRIICSSGAIDEKFQLVNPADAHRERLKVAPRLQWTGFP